VSVDTAFWLTGIVLEAAVVALLFHRQIFRVLPVFTFYVFWGLLTDLGMVAVQRWYPPSVYLRLFIVQLSIDSILQFCVLVELVWSVLRPYRSVLPRFSIFVIGALILLAGAAMWPISGTLALPGATPEWTLLSRLEQTSSALRILFFLLIAGGSQVLSLGWRSRELQVATGLGFYSLMSLGAAFLHSHHATIEFYRNVDRLVVATGFCSLLYWALCFAQKEAPRQEFSPKMQSLLFTVAGTARATRVALEEVGKSKR
jgi:hypothetical protein